MKLCLRLKDSLLPRNVLDAEWQEIEARCDRLDHGIRDLQVIYHIETPEQKWAWNGPAASMPANSPKDLHCQALSLLHAALEEAHPGTQLTSAAEIFHAAYLESESKSGRADAIAHCGIAIWFAMLAFFRRGARASLRLPNCGAPEELFLILALQPAQFPGGPTGSRLRSALRLEAIAHLHECLRVAMLCFQRAVELGRPALGVQWQIHVQRGAGNFAECRRIAAASSTLVGAEDRLRFDAYLKGIDTYQADLEKLALSGCTTGTPSAEWLHPEILASIAPICMRLKKNTAQVLRGDAFRVRSGELV